MADRIGRAPDAQRPVAKREQATKKEAPPENVQADAGTAEAVRPASAPIAKQSGADRTEQFDGAPSAASLPDDDGLADAANGREAPAEVSNLTNTPVDGAVGGKMPDSAGDEYASQLGPVTVSNREAFDRSDLKSGGLGGSDQSSGGLGRPTAEAALRDLGRFNDAQLKGMSDEEMRAALQAEADRQMVENTPLEGRTGADLKSAADALAEQQQKGEAGPGENPPDSADDQNAGTPVAGETAQASEQEQMKGTPGTGESGGEQKPDTGTEMTDRGVAQAVAEGQQVGSDTQQQSTGNEAGVDSRGQAEAEAHFEEFMAGHAGVQFQARSGGLRPSTERVDLRDVHRGGDPADEASGVAPGSVYIDKDAPPPGASTDGTTQPVPTDGTGDDIGPGPDNTSGDDWRGRPPGSDDGDDNPVSMAMTNDAGISSDLSFEAGAGSGGQASIGDDGSSRSFEAESDAPDPDPSGPPGGTDYSSD